MELAEPHGALHAASVVELLAAQQQPEELLDVQALAHPISPPDVDDERVVTEHLRAHRHPLLVLLPAVGPAQAQGRGPEHVPRRVLAHESRIVERHERGRTLEEQDPSRGLDPELLLPRHVSVAPHDVEHTRER